MKGLALEPFRGHAALAGLAADWDAALQGSAADPLCNSHAWNLAHARAYTRDADVFGWIGRDGDGAARAVLPFRFEPKSSSVQLQRVRLLADGTFDSDYLEPIGPRGSERETAELMIDALAAERRAQVAVIGVLDGERPAAAALAAAVEGRGLPSRSHADAAATAELPDTLEAYLAGLKKRVRSKLRQADRRVDELGLTVEWLEPSEASALPAWLSGLFDLHTRRWHSLDQPGSFADAPRREFYAELFPTALAGGWLRFARLLRGTEPLAYQAGFRLGDTYYQLQEGYAPEHEQLRPGSVLRIRALRDLIGEGVRRYDFMAGLTRHKTEWGGVERGLETRAFPLPGRLRAKAAYAARALLDRRG